MQRRHLNRLRESTSKPPSRPLECRTAKMRPRGSPPERLTPVFLVFSIAVSLPTASVVGGDQPASDAPGKQIAPSHELSFDESARINSVVFSPDGDSIYVLLNPTAINVWGVFVYHWPEVSGAFVAIVTLFSTMRIRKIIQRKRIVGRRYCRKCNYCVDELPGSRCPECGNRTAADHPVVGKPVWNTSALGASERFEQATQKERCEFF